MAFGVNSVMNMGIGALFASQAAIQTTGNNISNVNTPGYSRQSVVLQANYGIDYYPGQIGQGVNAKEVIRSFDAFVESSYLNKFSSAAGYHSLYSELRYVENLFNESNVDGLSSALVGMFSAWNKLSQQADSLATREALLASSNTLTSALKNADSSLRALEDQMNKKIQNDVDSANQLIKEIAQINREIAVAYREGRNNPNSLMDERDAKVRELAGIIDVQVQDNGPGDYLVNMKNGTTLVQNDVPFSLEFRGPQAENNLTASSPYKDSGGTVHFDGQDSREYTIEMVGGGDIDGKATFRVSLDGGKTWLTDANGAVKEYKASTEDGTVRVGNLDVWFDPGTVAQGDRFVISPKSDVYWHSPTAGPINISPQVYGDGSVNSSRIQGGSLGGALMARDYYVGEYRERLSSMSKSIAWEVNRIHSQGIGLKPLNSAMGTYSVGNASVPLGSDEARFTWSERLQAGNISFAVIDAATGKSMIPYPGLDVLSKLPGGNFDPSRHSLEDVRDAINSATFTDQDGVTRTPFSANIVDGKLQISTTDSNYAFSITSDTTGLAAALGVNTFFTGDSPETLAVREELQSDLNLINAGQLSVPGEITAGANEVAKLIAELANKKVSIGTAWSKGSQQSLIDYYSTIVTKVGSDTAGIKFTAATETAMAQDLYARQEEIKGVNLDEEMSNLIKFQASYKAAAKLVTTANEMIQTLLSMKQ